MEAPRIPFRERSASIAVLVFHSLNLSTEISINPIGSSCRNMGPLLYLILTRVPEESVMTQSVKQQPKLSIL